MGTYHFAMIRVEGLVDQRELLAAEATLQVEQMAKHPRLVLSSHYHYQFTSFLFACLLFS